MSATKINQMVTRFKELKAEFEFVDPEQLDKWHYTCVFRMNWWITNIEIVEKQYERIEEPIPENHSSYFRYQEWFTEWHNNWMESTGRLQLWKEYKQLEGDLKAYQKTQDTWKQQSITIQMTGKNHVQMTFPFLPTTE